MSGVIWFTIVAGPNGSGKTTLVEHVVEHAPALLKWVGSPLVLNPDIRARELREVEGIESREADERAVREIEELVKDCIRDRRSCLVETVLSTDKYWKHVLEAKRQGIKVALGYVAVSSADLAVKRVEMRVRQGGHGVPEDKIRKRYQKSLANLPRFMEHADWALVYCNDAPGSAGRPTLIARKDESGIHIENDDAFPELTKRLPEMISGELPAEPGETE